MNNWSVIFALICFFLTTKTVAQTAMDYDSLPLHLNWKNEKLELKKNYISGRDTLSISLLKFYLSDVVLYFEDGTIVENVKRHQLIDIEKQESLHFRFPNRNKKNIAKLVFNLGIDSIASVSGALSGDLDATNGMYWAWQSGYINLKIEGKSSSCKTRKNEFQFHIGGYLQPNYALREITLTSEKTFSAIHLDLSKFFEKINLYELNSVMIPGKKAIELADSTIQMFKAK